MRSCKVVQGGLRTEPCTQPSARCSSSTSEPPTAAAIRPSQRAGLRPLLLLILAPLNPLLALQSKSLELSALHEEVDEHLTQQVLGTAEAIHAALLQVREPGGGLQLTDPTASTAPRPQGARALQPSHPPSHSTASRRGACLLVRCC